MGQGTTRRPRAVSRPSSGVARLARAALCSTAILGSPTPASPQATAPDSTEVRSLRFEGNESFRASALQSAIESDRTHCRTVLLAPFCWFGGDWAIERRTLDRRELGRDIARLRLFYFRRGYREADVDTVVVERDSRFDVTFRIQEGQPVLVSSMAVEGDSLRSGPARVAGYPLQVGEPLSLLQLEATRDALLTDLGNRGYAHAEVLAGFFIPAEEPHTAAVNLQVQPGPLSRYGQIDVLGNQDLSESTIRRLMPVAEGDVYSDRQMAAAQRNVFQLDIVRHAEIVPDLSHRPDSVVPLAVRVNEAEPHRIQAGGGMSTFECLNVQGSWTSRNFRGGGRRLEVSTRIWNGFADQLAATLCTQAGTERYGKTNYRVAVEFLQPGVFSPRTTFSTRLFTERESFPDVFVRKTIGSDLLFSRSIGRLSATAATYRPQYGSFDAAEVYFCSNYLICSAEEIAAVSSASLLAPLGIQLSTDLTSPVTNPVRGWSGLVAYERAGTWTASDYRYDRVILEGSLFHELGHGSQRVLATRLRLGYLNPRSFGGVTTETTDVVLSAPSKRFYTGGATSVRGFAAGRLGPRSLQTDVRNLVSSPDSMRQAICPPEEILDLTCDASPLDAALFTEAPLGGNLLVLGNLEYRSWLTEKLQASLFLDFGQVWSRESEFALSDLEFTPGFGLRYPTPIGPIRLDLGYNFRKREPLPVLTSQLVALDPDDPREAVVVGGDGTRYAVSDELAPLLPPVDYGSDNIWSLNRLQLHFSLGQAF